MAFIQKAIPTLLDSKNFGRFKKISKVFAFPGPHQPDAFDLRLGNALPVGLGLLAPADLTPGLQISVAVQGSGSFGCKWMEWLNRQGVIGAFFPVFRKCPGRCATSSVAFAFYWPPVICNRTEKLPPFESERGFFLANESKYIYI